MIPVLERTAGAASTADARTKIDIRGVGFSYGRSEALHDVDLAVPANAVTAIIGPSGCGKSTLLRAINRIYEIYPDQHATGEILLDGENLLDRRYSLSTLRRRVGMVFQKPTPFSTSIRNNVAFALSYFERLSKSELTDRIEEALRQAALWDEVKDKLGASALSLSASSSDCASRVRSRCARKSSCSTNRRPRSIRSPRRASKS